MPIKGGHVAGCIGGRGAHEAIIRRVGQDGGVRGYDRRSTGRLFDEVPELYDRVRPPYPDELFADLVAITGVDEGSSVLEVGCGTGQATRSVATLGWSVTAVEPGAGIWALARRRLAGFDQVHVEQSTFEEWDDRGRRFHLLLAAACGTGWTRSRMAKGAPGPSARRLDGPDRQCRGPSPRRARGVRGDGGSA
jgi:hypothetical protein